MLPVVVVWNERDRVCCCLLLSEAAKTMCRVGGGGGGGEVVARTAQELAVGAQQREKRVDGVNGGEGGLVLGILHSHSRDCCVCLPVFASLHCYPSSVPPCLFLCPLPPRLFPENEQKRQMASASAVSVASAPSAHPPTHRSPSSIERCGPDGCTRTGSPPSRTGCPNSTGSGSRPRS